MARLSFCLFAIFASVLSVLGGTAVSSVPGTQLAGKRVNHRGRMRHVNVSSLSSPVREAQSSEPAEHLLEKRVDHKGRGTWFDVGLGNCGSWRTNNDPIIAIAKSLYDSNRGDNCDQWVEIVNTANGKKTYAQVQDSCESCGTNDIDMSPAVFQKIASLSTGQLVVDWHFQAKEWKP